MVLVSLEQEPDDLNQDRLQLILLLDVFFEHGQVVIIKLVFVLCLKLLLLLLLGVFTSTLGFSDETEELLLELLNRLGLQVVLACFLHDVSNSLSLSRETLGLEL